MLSFRSFDENTERLMIANHPAVSGVLVTWPSRTLPNLASRLGHALYQSSHVKNLNLKLDCFEREPSDSSFSTILQWIGTSRTLSSLCLSVYKVCTPRSRILLEQCLQFLCNRGYHSLPPLLRIDIFFGKVCVNTFVQILKVCRPASLKICDEIAQGTFTTLQGAVDCTRNAILANESLQELSLTVYPESVAIYCAIIEAVPHRVKIMQLNLVATMMDGRTVAAQEILDAIVPRLQQKTISLKRIGFTRFSFTEASPIDVLDHFLPHVEVLEFHACTFDEAASLRLLSIFDFRRENPRESSSGLSFYDSVKYPDSISMLEKLSGSPQGLHTLHFAFALPRQQLKELLAGLMSKSTCVQTLEFQGLDPSQISLIFDAIPLFRKLETLGIWIMDSVSFSGTSMFNAAKRNGSIRQYRLNWPNVKHEDRDRLEHCAKRNTHLPTLLKSIFGTLAPSDGNAGLAILPRLLRASMDMTAAASTHVLGSLLRSASRAGWDPEQPAGEGLVGHVVDGDGTNAQQDLDSQELRQSNGGEPTTRQGRVRRMSQRTSQRKRQRR